MYIYFSICPNFLSSYSSHLHVVLYIFQSGWLVGCPKIKTSRCLKLGINSWTWKQSSEEFSSLIRELSTYQQNGPNYVTQQLPVSNQGNFLTTDMSHQAGVYTCSFKRKKKGTKKMRPKPYMLISSQMLLIFWRQK